MCAPPRTDNAFIPAGRQVERHNIELSRPADSAQQRPRLPNHCPTRSRALRGRLQRLVMRVSDALTSLLPLFPSCTFPSLHPIPAVTNAPTFHRHFPHSPSRLSLEVCPHPCPFLALHLQSHPFGGEPLLLQPPIPPMKARGVLYSLGFSQRHGWRS